MTKGICCKKIADGKNLLKMWRDNNFKKCVTYQSFLFGSCLNSEYYSKYVQKSLHFSYIILAHWTSRKNNEVLLRPFEHKIVRKIYGPIVDKTG